MRARVKAKERRAYMCVRRRNKALEKKNEELANKVAALESSKQVLVVSLCAGDGGCACGREERAVCECACARVRINAWRT